MSARGCSPATPANDVPGAYRELIETRFGLRLTDHQARELHQKVLDLLSLTHFTHPLEMCQAFAAGWRLDLLQLLVTGVTIGETHFFRIRPQIEALRQVILPDLVERRARQRTLHIWSAGCSTGEEPYTLAILLRELLAKPDDWDLRVLASDVSGLAIEAAKRAFYRDWSFRDTPASVRERYFLPVPPDQWQLVDSVRNMVQFNQLNLVQDQPPGTDLLDLILCRNVTIYFSPEAVQRLYTRFADRLAVDGWLVLGPSDPLPIGTFEPEFVSGAVLWRRAAAQVTALSVPDTRTHTQPRPLTPRHRQRGLASSSTAKPDAAPLARPGGVPPARAQAEHIAATQPLNAEAHLLYGMMQMDAGALDQALTSLRRAVFLAPNDPMSQFSLGRVWMLTGRPDRARAALLDARRRLVGLADDDLVPNGGGIRAGELSHAIEAQLAGAA